MGWNQAYTELERNVIREWDKGTLTDELLRALMEPYRNSDIDHGGSQDLVSKDGQDCDEIIVRILRPKEWAEIQAQNLSRENGDYHDAIAVIWHSLTQKEFEYW